MAVLFLALVRPPLLIATSILVMGTGAGLYYFFARPAASQQSQREPTNGVAAAVASFLPERGVAKRKEGRIGAAFREGDLRGLRDALLAEGLPIEVAWVAVERVARDRLGERLRGLRQTARAEKGGGKWWLDGGDSPTVEQEAGKMEAELDAELRNLFPDRVRQLSGHAPNHDSTVAGPAYDFLPKERRELLVKIERDYDEMIREAELAVAGFEVPSDRAKIELLKTEKERDLAAALTPAERAELELRASPLAEGLRELVRSANVTEEEYRRLFALAKQRDKQAASDEPEKQALEYQRQVAGILGEERFRKHTRQMDEGYVALRNAAERFLISAGSVDQLYDRRDKIAAEAHRLGADTSLGPEQRREAGARLAGELRREVERMFASEPEAAKTYVEANLGWLTDLEQGARIEFLPDGSVRSAGPAH